MSQIKNKKNKTANEKGIALVVVIMLIAVLAILGAAAIIASSTDIRISGNYRLSNQAFYTAEAGIEEARARLRANAASPIVDSQPTNHAWRVYIGVAAKAQGKGYDPAQHGLYPSLSTLDYTVKIEHETDPSNPNQVLYWGDVNGDGKNERNAATGRNIYLVTSYGSAPGGAHKTIKVEMAKLPPISVPSPLYVEASTTIQGSSTSLLGVDQCGSAHKPGLVTTLGPGSVTLNGNPSITGTPPILPNGANMDIQAMIDSLKDSANFAYNITSATWTGDQGWGIPTPGATLQNPSSCSLHNIVYINTNETDIKLSGGVSGCGILLVEGDLDIHGNFSWYGPILLSGSVTFTGGGDKNITGAVLAGGSADADLVGGNANIVYCSEAVSSQTANSPLRILSLTDQSD